MISVPAIQTRFDGRYFRSRTEARWAVFFRALGVRYEHEPEGFVLKDGRGYLPDFKIWITRNGKPFPLWVEIKPKDVKNDGKIFTFAQSLDGAQTEAICLSALEDYRDHLAAPWSSDFIEPLVGGDHQYLFCQCPDCLAFGLEFNGRAARMNCCPQPSNADGHPDKNYQSNAPNILWAIEVALSARFGT